MNMMEALFSSVITVITKSNIYLILLSLIIVIAYILILMLSSGTIYRISISRADTNLNILEKLKENKGLNLSPDQEKICSDIITDSLINISTGYKLNSRNIHVYNHVLSITGNRHISNFAAKVKKESESIMKSTIKYFFSRLFIIIFSLLFFIALSLLLENILHNINSEKYTVLEIKSELEFFGVSTLMLLFLLNYIISVFNAINSLILIFYFFLYKNIKNYI
jgi:hypothetical protein